jgi:hypothetical protein
LAYGQSGRHDEALRLLHELEERASRGEYVAPFAPLYIHAGTGNVERVGAALAACLDDRTPLMSVRISCGPLLDKYRTNPAIDRLCVSLQNGTTQPVARG